MAEIVFAFSGFSAPGYTQVPDEFFDVCLSHLTGAETKVMCYLFRRTFGWKKDSDAVSLSQITDGIVRRDGVRLDSGAGVTRETASNALKGLEAKGLILRDRQTRPDGGTGTTVYRIRFRGESVSPTPPVGISDSPESSKPTPRVGKADSTPVVETDSQDPGVPIGQLPTTNTTWEQVRTALARRFNRTNWTTYIEPLQIESVNGGRVRVIAPNEFVGKWVRGRFGNTIAATFAEILGRPVEVDVIVAPLSASA